ncbi:MAG: T9SS type A sorting domain-containing protein [bacterium]|nr:T9SS type A sorting domain-containing protein [bacterium]
MKVLFRIGFGVCSVLMSCLLAPSAVFPFTWAVSVTIKGDSISYILTFATDPNGTDLYDQGLDVIHPPAPPGEFDAYFYSIEDTVNLPYSMDIDVRSSIDTFILWELVIVHSVIDSLFWSPEDLPTFGTVTLADTIDMRKDSIAVYSGNVGLPIIFSTTQRLSEGKNSIEFPVSFTLYQSYPNPFGSEAKIRFALPKKGIVNLKIYDASGRLVETLVNGEKELGYYTVKWNAKDYPAGIYFAKFEAGYYTVTKKLIMIR